MDNESKSPNSEKSPLQRILNTRQRPRRSLEEEIEEPVKKTRYNLSLKESNTHTSFTNQICKFLLHIIENDTTIDQKAFFADDSNYYQRFLEFFSDTTLNKISEQYAITHDNKPSNIRNLLQSFNSSKDFSEDLRKYKSLQEPTLQSNESHKLLDILHIDPIYKYKRLSLEERYGKYNVDHLSKNNHPNILNLGDIKKRESWKRESWVVESDRTSRTKESSRCRDI